MCHEVSHISLFKDASHLQESASLLDPDLLMYTCVWANQYRDGSVTFDSTTGVIS